jgi:hypothetical protein
VTHRFQPARVVRALLAATAAIAFSGAHAIEEPAFEVIERDGRIELRRYSPVVVAETVVEGDLDTASSRGFRLLAGYIFGDNRPRAGVDDAKGAQKIDMTAPVTVEPASVRIAMTAPVTVEPQGAPDADALSRGTRWVVRFTMPGAYTLATLPQPGNPAVTLRELPGARRAVVVFSGLAGEGKVREATAELLAWVSSRQLKVVGPPQLARYDPPWTLPFLRRNEVMVEVATAP